MPNALSAKYIQFSVTQGLGGSMREKPGAQAT